MTMNFITSCTGWWLMTYLINVVCYLGNMASMNVCRLCKQTSDAPTTVNIFTTRSQSKNWPSRISSLLNVVVENRGTLPPHVCKMCIRRVESLERSLVDLENFKVLAQTSLRDLSTRGPVKRTRVTGGDIGVSPTTARARPSAKLSRRQLFQCTGKYARTKQYYTVLKKLVL